MGNENPQAAVGRGTAYGRIGYGPGSSRENETLYAKATVETDGAGGIVVSDVDNIASVQITGTGDIFLAFTRSFQHNATDYSILLTEQAPGGGAGNPNREFRNTRNKSKAGFSIRAVDLAAAVVDHALVARAYTAVVFGRERVRG